MFVDVDKVWGEVESCIVVVFSNSKLFPVIQSA